MAILTVLRSARVGKYGVFMICVMEGGQESYKVQVMTSRDDSDTYHSVEREAQWSKSMKHLAEQDFDCHVLGYQARAEGEAILKELKG